MLRISRDTAADSKDRVLLRLEGQVTGLWVEEVRRTCNEAIGVNGLRGNPLVLDLADVSFIDADGVALFRDLTARGADLVNGSLFVMEQLKEVTRANR
jgi:anti-anti-sigma regulatory factor